MIIVFYVWACFLCNCRVYLSGREDITAEPACCGLCGRKYKLSQMVISIVIPCYNAEKTLNRTLKSAIRQKHRPIEIIIIDDGSTDGTAGIIKRYEKQFECIRSISQKNKGVSAARNTGVMAAQSDWIAFLDADDVFYKNSLSERVEAIHSKFNESMLGVFCPAELIFADGRRMGFGLMFGHSGANGRVYFSLTPESLFCPSCVIVSKKHFLASGGFDETLSTAEDYDLWHRMLRTGGYFQYVHTCKVGFAQHPHSAVHSKIMIHYQQCKKVSARIASVSPIGIEECKEGYGRALYHISLTTRALSSAFMAIASGHYAMVDALIGDISLYAIETFDLRRLYFLMKLTAARAVCKHEQDWYEKVWPAIRSDMIRFFEELDRRFEGRSQNVKAMLALFAEKRHRRLMAADHGVRSGAVGFGWMRRLKVRAQICVWDRLKWFVRDSLYRLVNHKKRAVLFLGLLILYTAAVIALTFSAWWYLQ